MKAIQQDKTNLGGRIPNLTNVMDETKMKQEAMMTEARDIMIEFADQTGLSSTKHPPRRYLWTDAYAVCNFLTLYRQTGETAYKRLALALIDQVHNILGRHREDDPRTGWISGLSDEEGQNHPTAGGLRIGKKLNERGCDDSYDEHSEWDRDGQYFHYLCKWMHALYRTSIITGEAKYCRWGVELAKSAHAGFSAIPRAGSDKRLYWKMSIDLSYPLVPSMSLHDPLDGFITYKELCLCTPRYAGDLVSPRLGAEIFETAQLSEGQSWETDDPLGIGGLLFDACRVLQMTAEGHFKVPGLLEALLTTSKTGLDCFVSQGSLNDPAENRLAFRELGLSIGLRAMAKIGDLFQLHPGLFNSHLSEDFKGQADYVPLSEIIEDFWHNPAHQQSKNWLDHRDINQVMLATSLAPEQFLSV